MTGKLQGRNSESTRTRKYLAGVATGYAVAGLTVVINLWLTPFTLRFLDRDEYALFSFSNGLLAWFVLLDLGLTSGLRAQVAQLTGNPDPERMNRLVSTTSFALFVLALLMIVAGGVVAAFAPRLFDVRPDLHDDASTTLLLLTLATAVNFATQGFSALLFAHQQIHYDNAIRMAQLILRTVVAVVLLLAGYKVIALAIATLVSAAFFSVLSVVRAYLSVPGLAISRRSGSRAQMWSDMKTLNFWYAVGNMAGAIIQDLDRIIAASIVSLASVTTLTLTARAYDMAFLLLAPLTVSAQPAIGQLIGEGRRAAAFDTYKRLLLLSVGAATIAALSLWSGNAAFVTSWVGTENYGGGALDLALMLNLIAFCWILPNRLALVVGLRARAQGLTRISEAILNLCLSILLGRRYGLIGIAAATALAAALTSCWLLPRLAADYFGHELGGLLRKIAKPLLLPLFILIPLAVLMRLVVASRGGYASALVSMTTVGACGMLLLWHFTLDTEMRARALEILRVTPRHNAPPRAEES